MKLTTEETRMLTGAYGRSIKKAMEILTALGKIYGAKKLIPVTSVQIAGVSYANLGEAGLQFLSEMAEGGGKAAVLTTLNPAGMDIENYQALGIDEEFARNQIRVIEAFSHMGVITTCTCTPYLSGNLPHYGEHIAWAESSAVCFANSVIGARTNREGGPSALASALTGRTPAYGFHLEENRQPDLVFSVAAKLKANSHFGALGKAIGSVCESRGSRIIPFITGIEHATTDQLKALCASIATYGGTALFHMDGITPEAPLVSIPEETVSITQADLDRSVDELTNAISSEIDFVSMGCPHLSI
jgi:predicted aconitase